MTVSGWRDPLFVSAAHAWLRETAAAHAIVLTGPIDQPFVRPWATVFRAPAAGLDVYLKACAAAQRHEPAILELVARERPDLVPEVVARHPIEPWILLRDGGEKLSEVLPAPRRLAVWRELLPRYAELQRALLGREVGLLRIGLPDRRLDRVTGLLERVLEDDRACSPDARAAVRARLPAIRRACAELEAVGIGASLDHDDLHQYNVLLRGGRATIIDWGDASLTHPFLTLAVTLDLAAPDAALDGDAPEIGAMRDAYLEPWTTHAPAAALRRAADLGEALGTITGALTWYDITTAIQGAREAEPDELSSMLERIARAFARLGPI